MADNKVKYGLKNVYVAPVTESLSESGAYTYSYGTPKAVKGAVNLSLDPEGDKTEFFADDVLYYQGYANSGYTGTLEMALIPDWFAADFLKEAVDDNGIQAESAAVEEFAPFALLFEFAGDVKATRHVMYYCTASRRSVGSQTKEKSKEPRTESLNLTCSALKDETMLVKAKTTESTDAEKYSAWFTTVQVAGVELADFQ